MAIFNIEFAQHRLHAFLQRGKFRGYWMAAGAGASVSAVLVVVALFQTSNGVNREREATLGRLKQTQATVAKLKAEKLEQTRSFEQLANAPITAQGEALNAGGYSEGDVAYWRKQMDAFSQMAGVRLTIVGRGSSKFKQATKLTVRIGSTGSGGESPLAPGNLVKALDFLQLYGYVESFNGTEAVVHILEKNS